VRHLLGEHLPPAGRGHLQVVPAELVGGQRREQVVVAAPEDTAVLPVEQPGMGLVRQQVPTVEVLGVDHHVGVVQNPLQQPLAFAQGGLRRRSGTHLGSQGLGLPTQLELADDLTGERRQMLDLQAGQRAGDDVENAQRAEDVPRARHQRRAGVEPQPRLAGHQRVVGEPRVQGRVRHDQRSIAGQRMGTERHLPRRLAHRQPEPGLEPLPVAVHQAHQRHRRATHMRGQRSQVAERFLRVGVEHPETAQRPQPLKLGDLRDLSTGGALTLPAVGRPVLTGGCAGQRGVESASGVHLCPPHGRTGPYRPVVRQRLDL